MAASVPPSTRVVVVGAGFGGVAVTAELLAHGFDDVVVLEAGERLGGTWQLNDYPGAACDVPSHMYSLSYAPKYDWTRFCPPQPEIEAHLVRTAERLGVTPRVVTGVSVEDCRWDEGTSTWTVTGRTADGAPVRHVADALVLATGQLNQPAVPAIEGREEFTGVSFHSARWDHGFELFGKRVAVIGTGASAVQFVPAIASEVASLTVFQRTGNWFLPRQNNPYPGWLPALFRRVPFARRGYRAMLYAVLELLTAMIRHPRTLGLVGRVWSSLFMRGQLTDPEVRRKVWPHYTFGCKRVLFSSTWLPTLQRRNVEVVTDAIARIRPSGVETVDGTLHEVDAIVWGTGFRTLDFMFPMTIEGVGGRTLREAWADGAHAHLGVCVPGFPSMFVMYGPNTNTSGGSILFFLEAQARYVRQALELRTSRGASSIEVRADVEAAADRTTQERFAGTAWLRCDSWYRSGTGRIVTNWPGYMTGYHRATRSLDPADFVLR